MFLLNNIIPVNGQTVHSVKGPVLIKDMPRIKSAFIKVSWFVKK